MIYENGVLMIPFATRNINATGIPVPIKIPDKTKPSFLFIKN